MHQCPTLRAAFHIVLAGAPSEVRNLELDFFYPHEIITAASVSVALQTASRPQVITP
jgi:hypothetical protein